MTKRDFSHLPYRRGVGIMLLNDRAEVFVAQRIDMPSSAWQMPQGGIDEGEDPAAAAWREMAEEIGTDKAELLAESRTGIATICRPTWCRACGKAGIAARNSAGSPSALRAATTTSISRRRIRNSAPGAGRRWRSCRRSSCHSKRPLYMQLVEEFQPVVSKLGSAKR